MKTSDIILWTTSIILSIFSITFAAFAAYSSTKANRRLKDTISAEWISSEAAKLFFEQIKIIQKQNRLVLKRLDRSLTYKTYASISSNTRFTLIPKGSRRIIAESDYNNLLESYILYKKELEEQFHLIINVELLETNDNINIETRKKLISYHSIIKNISREILIAYVTLNEGTKDVKTKEYKIKKRKSINNPRN